MRILITSGGTKVPIDPVRDITNMSSGRFGSNIATAFLERDHDVHYMVSKYGRSPFSTTFDFYQNDNWEREIGNFARLHNFCQKHRKHYHEYRYKDFEEYAAALEQNIKYLQPDIVLLAAAVSDYLVPYTDNKMRSSDDMTLRMTPAPKLIAKVKLWHPETTLVGFKLLVEATDDQLFDAAQGSITTNGCDMVVANDLRTIMEGKHRIIIVRRNREKSAKQPFLNYEYGEGCDLAREVVENALHERSMACKTSSSV